MDTSAAFGGRYRLGDELGRGAHGIVYSAVDAVTGASVAVKIAHRGLSSGALRIVGEAALLGLLRLPGVVTYRDHGHHERQPFLVVDLVPGTPFPGTPLPMRWEQLAPVLRSLLEVLARLHFHGVAHRDLKPSNVLVDEGGRAHVLDFGLAHGRATLRGDGASLEWSGTPAYVAPERVDASMAVAGCDAVHEDLYAVGVMTFEALSGVTPHQGATSAELLSRRLDVAPPHVADVANGVPAHVAAIVDRLLSRNPAERPASAGDVIRSLFADQDAREMADRLRQIGREPGQQHEPLDARAIRSFVAGPDRVLHLQEDTATELLRRTGGDPVQIADEIGVWVRAGRAAWVDEQLVVSRRALDALRAEPVSEAEADDSATDGVSAWVRSQLRAGANSATFLTEAPRVAVQLVHDGRAAEGVELLRRAIRLARADADEDHLPALLSALGFAALAARTPINLNRAIQEFDAIPAVAHPIDASREMLEAARLIPKRHASALSRLRGLRVQRDSSLEIRRRALMAEAASRHGPGVHSAVLDDLKGWADSTGDSRATSSCATWRAFLHYRLGEFDQAARMHLRSAAETANVTAQFAAYGNAAAALLESGSWIEAEDAAQRSRVLAAECRNAHYEARAECLLRCIAYRQGVADKADLELVEAAAVLADERYLPTVLLTEAAVAWRSGDDPLALDLAERTVAACRGPSDRWYQALARGLLLKLNAVSRAGEARELAGVAMECPLAGVAVQIAGLIAHALAGDSRSRLATVAERASEIANGEWNRRREVLSIAEALAALKASTG